jgi:hypothetical protein
MAEAAERAAAVVVVFTAQLRADFEEAALDFEEAALAFAEVAAAFAEGFAA